MNNKKKNSVYSYLSIKKLNKFLRLNKIFLATDKKFKYVYNAILQSLKMQFHDTLFYYLSQFILIIIMLS